MARNIGVNFNGKRIVKPGAYSNIDTSELVSTGSGSEKKIVFIGSSTGGEPGVYHSFSSYPAAKEVLRGGDLLTAAELAWSPSNDGRGAGEIGFIRVEDAKRATLEKTGINFTSKLYGAEANKVQAKIEAGSIADSKRLVLYFWQDNIRETYDNLGPVFTIKYTGDGSDATIDVKHDINGKAEEFVITVDGAARTLTIGDSGEFKEVNKLVSELSNYPDIAVSVATTGNKNLATVELDAVTAVDITEQKTVTALKGDIKYQTAYSLVADIDVVAGDIVEFPFEFFTGGTNGMVPASWATQLYASVGEGAYIVVPLTKDEAIHAEVARFVEHQSSAEHNEMRAFYGGGLGEPVDVAINRAVTLNSTRATLCYPAITRNLVGGEAETLPAYFTAAIIAGRVASVEVGEPVTFDYLNLIGVEKVLTSDEITKLLEGGVTPIEYVRSRNRKGFRIVQSITTYQEDNNPALRENSVSEIVDFTNADLREFLEARFVGTKGLAVTASLIKNAVQSFLDDKVRDGWFVEYDPSSVIVQDGEVIRVAYAAVPAFGINYILISGKFVRSQIVA